MTTMFETIKRLYAKTGNAAVVERAMAKGWITEVQKEEILGSTQRVAKDGE